MDKHAKIYVAGHRGLVGSGLMRNPRDKGYANYVSGSPLSASWRPSVIFRMALE